jgi:hypothetical protein
MCITRFNRTESIALGRNILRNDCCDAVRVLLSASESMNNVPAKIALKASSQKPNGALPIVTLKAIFEQLAEAKEVGGLACKTSKPADLVPHGRDSDMPLSDPGE